MPRFYFHVFDGKDQRDDLGAELPDFDAARVVAIRFAGEILKDEAHQIALGHEWRMDVTDASDMILFRLDFSAVASPAARPHLK
ncbi:DUF6894 family protein [Methylobacterium radiotolerans]|uniref:DUF6894 family protein n=1 Tax=Methylobacterium radiotolerans TaxID=31998 RepID=UPI001F185878|nr:hypothetical protein [Methylobacterium radiotolerans]UIY45679.1 hypothetical protein LZ599_31495 [Methylobacterium radiotolerans]